MKEEKPMKLIKQSITAIALSGLIAVTPLTFAAGGHGHDNSAKHDSHNSGMSGMFLKKKEIDGYTVSFHVMKAKPGKEMGGSHDFMIKIEKDGKALKNLVMNTKVKHPDGSSESKKTMKMGDWLMAGYDLGHEGKHQMMILFKTPDGKKHKGGVYYP
jgi:hypothetical protein